MTPYTLGADEFHDGYISFVIVVHDNENQTCHVMAGLHPSKKEALDVANRWARRYLGVQQL